MPLTKRLLGGVERDGRGGGGVGEVACPDGLVGGEMGVVDGFRGLLADDEGEGEGVGGVEGEEAWCFGVENWVGVGEEGGGVRCGEGAGGEEEVFFGVDAG